MQVYSAFKKIQSSYLDFIELSECLSLYAYNIHPHDWDYNESIDVSRWTSKSDDDDRKNDPK